MWAAQCGLRDVGCAMGAAQCGLRDVGCAMWAARCGLRDVGSTRTALMRRMCVCVLGERRKLASQGPFACILSEITNGHGNSADRRPVARGVFPFSNVR